MVFGSFDALDGFLHGADPSVVEFATGILAPVEVPSMKEAKLAPPAGVKGLLAVYTFVKEKLPVAPAVWR